MAADTPSVPAHVPSAGRQFRRVVGGFAVGNLIVWALLAWWLQPRHALLRVERFSPGENAVVSARPTLQWRFNLDVMPTSEPPGTITPAVSGRWEWTDPRTLLFVPEADLNPATAYRIELATDRLRTPEHFRLAERFAAGVMTAPLEVRGVRQAGTLDGGRFVLELTFSDRVIPADVPAKLKLTGPDGKALGFSPHGDAAGEVVRIATAPVAPPQGSAARTIRVSIDRGLAGVSGPLGLREVFEDAITLEEGLVVTEALAEARSRGQAELRLRLTGEPDLDALRRVISVEPGVAFTLSRAYDGLRLTGDFRPGTRYAVRISPPPPGADRTRYPRPDVLSVFVPDREADVWFDHTEGYLGSRGNRTVLAHAVNVPQVELRLHRVYDNNLVAWRNAGRGGHWRNPASFSRPVATKRLKLDGKKNEVQDLRLSLDELLPAGSDDGVYRVELRARGSTAPEQDFGRFENDYGDSASAIVTLSDIALTAKRQIGAVTVWAVSLSTAKPQAAVRVRLYSDKNQLLGTAITDADGLATISHPQPADGEQPRVVLADRQAIEATSRPSTQEADGPDEPTEPDDEPASGLTWLDLSSPSWDLSDSDIGGRSYLREGLEAFVYTDRGVFRPGDTLHLRAIVRNPAGNAPKPFPLRWQLRRPDGRDWRGEVTMIDADGGAGLSLHLPDDLTTGRWTAHLGVPGEGGTLGKSVGSVSFLIEEFIPDRMKVAVTYAGAPDRPDGPDARVTAGDEPLTAQVQADYLFGQSAAGLRAELTARLEPAEFAPPRWQGWAFGDQGKSLPEKPLDPPDWAQAPVQTRLDGGGRFEWPLDLAALRSSDPGRFNGPWQLTVSAGVRETGGRAVTASRQITVDVLRHYVGLRPATSSPRPGSAFDVAVALVAPDGEAVNASASLRASVFRQRWNTSLVSHDGRYHFQSTRVLDLEPKAVASVGPLGAGRGTIAVTLPDSGSYVLRVTDPATGAASSIELLASDGSPWDDNTSRENPERLELVVLPPDAATQPSTMPTTSPAPDARAGGSPAFRVGQTARVLVRSPFAGRLLLCVETDRVVKTHVVEIPASQVVVPVEVTDACRPGAWITATVVREIKPDVKWRTHRAFGVAPLRLDSSDGRLDIAFQAPAEIRPNSSLDITLRLTDSAGRPASGAAVTLAAVDEGILQLTRFPTPDPLAFFTARRALGVIGWDVYGLLMPEVPRPSKLSAVGGDGALAEKGDEGRHRSPVPAKRVKPVALFNGVLQVDAGGVARTSLHVPPFAGRLRLMAVAHGGSRFGSGQQDVIVRSPLVVQSSFPRFAAPGDTFTATLQVFNNTPAGGDLKVVAEVLEGGPLSFEGDDARRLTLTPGPVPAGGQTTLSLPVAADRRAGVAKIRLVVSLATETVEETIELPVQPASPTVTRGGFLAVKPGEPHALPIPQDVLPGTASLDIRVTPWPSLQLPEGLDYLERYPYGCAEQTASTCFPLVYLSEIGPKIAPGVFEKRRVEEKLQAGILRLIGMQTADGGVAMWPGSRQTWEWASVYTAHLVVEAEAAGHAVPEDFRRRLLGYVRRLLDRTDDTGDALELQAYACYVLSLAGKPERPTMSRLGELANASTPEQFAAQRAQTRLYLALGWMAAGRRDLATALLPQGMPSPRNDRQHAGNLGSPVRDRALLVSALMTIQPDHPALPSLVQQLADAGRQGQWRSTQDCAFAVMAIGKYLRQARSEHPYESAALLQRAGGQLLAQAVAPGGELVWRGRDATDELAVRVEGAPDCVAHVSWLQTGVPLQAPPAADNGLKVRRTLLDRDGKPIAGNRVRSGDLVRVELLLEAPPGQENLIVEDLLPAGLEIENPRLEMTATLEDAGDGTMPDLAPDRLDLRDDRLILAARMPEAGRARYVYLARAVTPGSYALPPVRAECMYDLATNSLAGAGRITVEAVEAATARKE